LVGRKPHDFFAGVFRVQDLRMRVQGSGFIIWGLEAKLPAGRKTYDIIQDSRLRVEGSGFIIWRLEE